MENLEEALAPTLGSCTAVANLDLEEERTEGKAVVAMPQLIKVLEAIIIDTINSLLCKISVVAQKRLRLVIEYECVKEMAGNTSSASSIYKWDIGESKFGL